jgi:transcriptional regulator with GAF, ATPase, and Fis domain
MPVMDSSPALLPAAGVGDLFAVPHALEATDELLHTISEVLDVRDAFPRIAQIAGPMLQHDCLTLAVYHESGAVAFHARSVEDFPDDHGAAASGAHAPWLVRDIRTSGRHALSPHDAEAAPASFLDSLSAAGYRSLLCVRRMARDRAIRLGFFSRRVEAYSSRDIPCAQRIAAVIAVAVSHQELARAQFSRVAARAKGERLELRVQGVLDAVKSQAAPFKALGSSPGWRQVLRKAVQVAHTDTTVFVRGESGTGKEVVARFIHGASPRRSGPFVAINCAALPEHLLESELFGYERGAFTGAHQAKMGQIELASTGVLFLDEVSEMSPNAQAKLLRFLQEREFQRLGGTRVIKANVRVIAASNRDLLGAVADGSFREDLYYRLHVFDIQIPPLRERQSDIPLLAAAFLQDFSRHGCPAASLSIEASEMLMRYRWPGNIRQLRNALERAAILSDGEAIEPEHLSLHPSDVAKARSTDLPNVERRTIEQALRETEGNKSSAARRLGITRTQLYCRMRKHGLDAD